MRHSTESLSDQELRRLVDKVLVELKKDEIAKPCAGAPAPKPWEAPAIHSALAHGIFNDLDHAVAAATTAFQEFQKVSLEKENKNNCKRTKSLSLNC